MNLKTVRSKDPFTRVSNTLLADPRISWGAKGIAAYLVGKPDGWKMRIADLVKRGIDGKCLIRAAINELRAFGYARYTQPRINGRLGEGVWEISDQVLPPESENQETEPRSDFQEPDGGEPDNQHHSKNDSNKTESTKRERAKPSTTPIIEDIAEYALELGMSITFARRFFDHYESTGWKHHGSRITDWKAKMRNWQRTERSTGESSGPSRCIL